jgi:hypothetical protein
MPRIHRHTLHKFGMLLGAYGTVSFTKFFHMLLKWRSVSNDHT